MESLTNSSGRKWSAESDNRISRRKSVLVFFFGFSNECLIKTYSMKQPDPYYFETIQMTSQA